MQNKIKILLLILVCFLVYENNRIKKTTKEILKQNNIIAEQLNYLVAKENVTSSSLNIDKIYLINLDKSKDRLAHMQKLLVELNFPVEYIRFSAIDGKKLNLINKKTKEKINIAKLREKGETLIGEFTLICADNEPDASFDIVVDFKTIPPRAEGAYGVACSHRLIWNEMIKKGYEKILVLEDDLVFDPFTKFKLSSIISYKQAYDLLFLGPLAKQNFYKQEFANELISRINKISSMEAYVISENGAKKLLGENNYSNLPIDLFITKLLEDSKIIAYAPKIPLTSQNQGSVIGAHIDRKGSW